MAAVAGAEEARAGAARRRIRRSVALAAAAATVAGLVSVVLAAGPAQARAGITREHARTASAAVARARPGATAKPGTPHTVSYDGYSFIIDGKRTYLWSGEFHYFR